jgi:hypothetical protein
VKLRELSADERARDMSERREKQRRDESMRERWAVKQSHLEIAKNMIADGEPIDKILRYTGLTREEIEGLRR